MQLNVTVTGKTPGDPMNVHSGQYRPIDGLAGFEAKLIELFGGTEPIVFAEPGLAIGLERSGSRGEVALSLVAQEMRDFCIVETLPADVLARFAGFVVAAAEKIGATRLRIGPLSASRAAELNGLLAEAGTDFAFHASAMSVEPLIDKSRIEHPKLCRRLRVSRRKAERRGLTISNACMSVADLARAHEAQWGRNRSLSFFEAICAFAREPYGECVSLVDPSGEVVAMDLHFTFGDICYSYYRVRANDDFAGAGTALLAETIERFFGDEKIRLFSFGRGGESYKYEHANCYRTNFYAQGFRVCGKEEVA